MFTNYGFNVTIQGKENAPIYRERLALEYLNLDDVGSPVYLVNENRLTTIRDCDKVQQVVGEWIDEDTIYLFDSTEDTQVLKEG